MCTRLSGEKAGLTSQQTKDISGNIEKENKILSGMSFIIPILTILLIYVVNYSFYFNISNKTFIKDLC